MLIKLSILHLAYISCFFTGLLNIYSEATQKENMHKTSFSLVRNERPETPIPIQPYLPVLRLSCHKSHCSQGIFEKQWGAWKEKLSNFYDPHREVDFISFLSHASSLWLAMQKQKRGDYAALMLFCRMMNKAHYVVGSTREAMSWGQKAVGYAKKLNHFGALCVTQTALGLSYKKAQKPQLALATLQKALSAKSKAKGLWEESFWLFRAFFKVYMYLSDYKQAALYREDALRVLVNVDKKKHYFYQLIAKIDQAAFYFLQKKAEKAEHILLREIKKKQIYFNENLDFFVAKTYELLFRFFVEQDPLFALHYAEKALAVYHKIWPEKYHPSIIALLSEMAGLEQSFGAPKNALKYLEYAFAIKKTYLPSIKDAVTLSLAMELGLLQHKLGLYEASLSTYNEAKALCKNIYGEKANLSKLMIYNARGDVYWDIKAYDRAYRSYMKALGLLSALYLTQDAYMVIDTYSNLAMLLLDMEKYEEALSYAKKVGVYYLEKRKEERSKEKVQAFLLLATLYTCLNLPNKASKYRKFAMMLAPG